MVTPAVLSLLVKKAVVNPALTRSSSQITAYGIQLPLASSSSTVQINPRAGKNGPQVRLSTKGKGVRNEKMCMHVRRVIRVRVCAGDWVSVIDLRA